VGIPQYQDQGDEWKAAIATPFGIWEPTVMQMGFANAPATFQRYMDHILKDLIKTGQVKVYIDNILIFTKTRRENQRLTHKVMETLEKNKICLKPSKCEFEKEKITLGMDIKFGTIKPGTK
jgi:Reverse transcriptase (RNA-dependent DNA polymerase)